MDVKLIVGYAISFFSLKNFFMIHHSYFFLCCLNLSKYQINNFCNIIVNFTLEKVRKEKLYMSYNLFIIFQ